MRTPQPTTTRLAYGPETLQFSYLHLPISEEAHPVVILIHGGFWRNPYTYTLMTSMAEDLAQRGIAAWNIEYRRVGDKGGGWPGTLLDVALAADYLRTIAARYKLDLNRIVTIGHSAGGQLALWLAARRKITLDSPLAVANSPDAPPLALRGAISLAGVNDLERSWQFNLGSGAATELLGGSVTSVPERYAAASPAAMLPLGIPQVLIHGTEDDRVPYAMSESYFADAQAAGDDIKLITLEGEDHFVLIDIQAAAWEKTVQALRTLLGLDE
ncbi:MAG: alpha/beta hydrolase family protein [Ktedonobacteraceae bacterium]